MRAQRVGAGGDGIPVRLSQPAGVIVIQLQTAVDRMGRIVKMDGKTVGLATYKLGRIENHRTGGVAKMEENIGGLATFFVYHVFCLNGGDNFMSSVSADCHSCCSLSRLVHCATAWRLGPGKDSVPVCETWPVSIGSSGGTQ